LFGYGLGGVAHGAKNVLIRTLLHQRVPEARRGGAFAAYNAARNGAELGALLLGGLLLGLVGARTSLFIAGFGAVIVAVVAHRSTTTTKGAPTMGMFITTYAFAGDPAELLPRYHAMIEEIGPENLELHFVGATDGGLHVVDACPSREARDGWVAASLPGLLARHGLPQPAISDGFDVHFGITRGAEVP